MKNYLLALICLLIMGHSYAQEKTNPRVERPFCFKVGAITPADEFYPNLIFKASYFKNHNMEYVAEAGIQRNFNIGFNYHFNDYLSKSALSPYIGLNAGAFENDAVVNFNVGINCILANGLTASASISPMYELSNSHMYSNLNFAIGWSFRK